MAEKDQKKKTKKRRRINRRVIAAAVTAACLILIILAIFFLPKNGLFSSCANGETFDAPLPLPVSGQLSVYVLDVGQGNACILVSPSGKTMLIDSGDSWAFGRVRSALSELGIERLDAVVATHPHADHAGAMPALLSQIDVGEYYMPECNAATILQPLIDEALSENGVHSTVVWSGDTIDWDEKCTLTVLSPVISCWYSESDANDISVILRVEFGENAILFTGDATIHAEQLSMYHNERELFEADVLMVSHHGSTTGASYGFYETVGGEYAVISVGKNNQYGHPDFSVLNMLDSAGYRVLRTDLDGNISLFLDGETVAAECSRQSKK